MPIEVNVAQIQTFNPSNIRGLFVLRTSPAIIELGLNRSHTMMKIYS